MDKSTESTIRLWAEKYNDPAFFKEDPIAFPRHFAQLLKKGQACLQDVEIAGILAAHLAWGRREMIVRDTTRLMDSMDWQPYRYVMEGHYRDDDASLHRTVKWSEIAAICSRLRRVYGQTGSLEDLDIAQLRTEVLGSKPDRNAANKKINMFRRWMVRDDGKVDLGIWTRTRKKDLLIPLDVHVGRSAVCLGLTGRTSADIRTVMEITDSLRVIFPDDPCLGDFALFGHSVSKGG